MCDFKHSVALLSCQHAQQLCHMKHPCVTLTNTKTPNKQQRSFFDVMQKQFLECKVMLHCDGKLLVAAKLGIDLLVKHV